ncbi:DUF4926 domain-containing protein [Methylobacterium sp. WL30]|uniref:DUF4926 domain-containing protein n=1 Tax=unclassified Methylobacterium TaxID=2615210 RepID=UPI0011CBF001|nr:MULTISPECIES: DUF4926 domain-containing protein [unclassified Methylobacterium]TXN40664.1 DUF4926 domain-containing protein [Methylobacterium sp. WL93]TXN49988.1 DUF4926 domain-containing protein [Methylobacterium sp. WL119]TXN61479.1 DUF4926 domain-containing protein [Methylobacterium sp. WL30]
MSVQFAYRFQQDLPPSSLQDLDDVVLTAAVMSDDGISIPAGTEGTIVSVFRGGEAYVVEFAQPEGTLASVGPDEIRMAEPAAP